jgi:hypothetical protein
MCYNLIGYDNKLSGKLVVPQKIFPPLYASPTRSTNLSHAILNMVLKIHHLVSVEYMVDDTIPKART